MTVMISRHRLAERRRPLGPLFVCAALIAFLLCGGAIAQPTGDTSAIFEGRMPATAPVTIDGRTLFRVRGVSAYTAEQRAQDIAGRIAEFAETDQPVSSIHSESDKLATAILGGEVSLMNVYDEDGRVEGVGRELLARAHQASIARAVTSYREDRTRSALLRAALLTLAATAILAVATLLWVKVLGALTKAFERRYQRRIEQLEAESFQLIRARSVWTAAHAATVVVGGLVLCIAFYLYAHFALSLYPWTRGLSDRLLALLLGPLAAAISNVLLAIPKLIVVAIVGLIAYYLLRSARLFFGEVERGHIKLANFDADWANPTLKLVRVLIIAFAAVIAYPYIPGSETAAFKGVTIFIGVLFSLGSSSLIANIIAGYTMTYRRAFHVGDRISIGTTIGDVTQVRALVTHLRSVKNEELIIPNSTILASQVTNFSSLAREKGLILHTIVGIGYETPWRQVEAMLLMAAARTEGVLHDPPPFVWQKGLDNFCVTYELNVYCDRPLQMYQLYDELHRRILDVFNEYQVQIMTPAYVADPATPKVVPKDQWFAEPALTLETSQRAARETERLPAQQAAGE